MPADSQNQKAFARYVLDIELPAIDAGTCIGNWEGEFLLPWIDKLDECRSEIVNFVSKPSEDILVGAEDRNSPLSIELAGVECEINRLVERSRLFDEMSQEYDINAVIGTLPYENDPLFARFIQILASSNLDIDGYSLEEHIELCFLAAFYGASGLVSKLCGYILSETENGAGAHGDDPCLFLLTHLDAVTQRRPCLVVADSDPVFIKKAKQRQNKCSSLMKELIRLRGECLPSFRSVCGLKNTSRDFTFRIVDNTTTWMKYCDDNFENKISTFLNFISSPEFVIRGTNEAYDFHVPCDNFCSLKMGQKAFIRGSYKFV
jgi:hypothetical protein